MQPVQEGNEVTLDVSEAEFQAKVIRAIGSKPEYRLWRHFVGKLYTEAGHPIRVGIKGSCDLTGLDTRTGRRLEIEMKAAGGKRSPEQINWGERMTEQHAIYLVATYDKSLSMRENIERVLAELEEKSR